jgi:DNA-binding transcriptional LysR family regulator
VNLRALRTFVATVEEGGLGRAAVRLSLSQPAASRKLHALETVLGVPLFQRDGRQLRLTAEGEDLFRQSRQLLTAADALVDRARALKRGHTGTLKVAATPQVIAGVLAPFLRHHQRRHPEVDVQLVEGGAAQQPDRLERGEVQLAIMPAGDERFDGRLLYPVHALVVLADGHRLCRRAVVEVAELAEDPVLLLRREFGSRRWFDAACEIASFRPRVRFETAAPQTLVELAAVGYGAAVVPSTMVLRSEGVRAAPLVQNHSSLGRWSMVAWGRRRHLPEYARQFVDQLVTHSRRDPPGTAFIRRAPRLPRPKLPLD